MAKGETLYRKCADCNGTGKIRPQYTYSKHISGQHFDFQAAERKVRGCEHCEGVGFIPVIHGSHSSI